MVMKREDGARCLGLVLESIRVEGCVQEPLQLHKMSFLVTCGWGSCRLSAGVPNGTGVVEGSADAWLDIVVVALILVLFLAPQQLSLRILLCLSFNQVKWEWRKLLNAADGHCVLQASGLSFFGKVIINFSCAEDETLHSS